MTFAVSALGYDLGAAGVAFAIMQAASVVGRPLLGWLADRFGSPRRLLGLIASASGLTSLAMAFVGPAGPIRYSVRWRRFGASAWQAGNGPASRKSRAPVRPSGQEASAARP